MFTKNLMFKVKSFLGIAKQDKKDIFDDINVDDSEIENKPSSDS